MNTQSFKGTKLCLDNTVLSALFIQLSPDDGNHIISLLKKLGFELVVSQYVYFSEFLRGLNTSESDFESPFSVLSANSVDFLGLLQVMDHGEASTLALALEINGVMVTDDRTARRFCKSKNIPLTGTVGLLILLVCNEVLSADEAGRMFGTLIERHFFIDCDSLKECCNKHGAPFGLNCCDKLE